jgi:ABC-type bacteriocin/lantibiotic exporter with double-glycine peptidase domain
MLLLNIPHRLQQRDADCLVACVAMVLEYLHIPIRYERLYKLLRAQPFGTPFRNVRFLKSLDLSITVRDGDFDALLKYVEIGLPVIAYVDTIELPYWNRQSTDHAIVIVGLDIDEQVIYVNDPFFDDAPQKLAIERFESAWLEKEYLCPVISLTEVD